MREGASGSHDLTGSALSDLERAVEAQDWDAATIAVRRGWFALAADHADATRKVLERIPSSALHGEPLLAMELGILLNQAGFQRTRALRYFVGVVRTARSSKRLDVNPVDRLLIRTAESEAFRLLGRYTESVDAAHAALELVNGLNDEERRSIDELPRVYTMIGVSLFYAGRSMEAIHAASAGLSEVQDAGSPGAMSPLALLAGIHALRGDIPRAREYVEAIRTGPWYERQRNGPEGTFYRLAESMLALETFDIMSAREEIGKLDSILDSRRPNENWAVIARAHAMIELVDGQAGAGLALLDELFHWRGAETGSRHARAFLAPVRSHLLLALGHPDGATAVLRRDLPDGVASRIERARVALALGNTGSALNELRTLSGEHLSNRQRAEVAAIDLSVLLRLAPTPRQPGVVQRLGSLLERSEQRLAIMLLPPTDFSRVVFALRDGGFGGLVSALPDRGLLADVEPDSLLSKRELAVLEQLMQTPSVSDIAAALVVSSNTVKSQLRSIYRKLGVTSREDAVAVTLERHLIAQAQEA